MINFKHIFLKFSKTLAKSNAAPLRYKSWYYSPIFLFQTLFACMQILSNHPLTLPYSRKQSQSLQSLILWVTSFRLSTRFNNKVDINPALSINFILQNIVTTLSIPSLSIFLASFCLGTEKVLYFSVFCSRHSNCPSNSFANLW